MKNIVVCCDGTGNEFGDNNTNVVLTSMVAKKSKEQVVFYDPGVGTGGWEYEDGVGFRAKSDQATGNGLMKNVKDAYSFLMRCYEEGDRVYLFGFSRGAFTARSLAGMLHKCGLLRTHAGNLVEYAAKMYNTRDNESTARDFKQTFCRACPVHFIGVWDTVESLLLNAGKRFHDCTLNPEVSAGFHALAIDEQRQDFPPCLWNEANRMQHQIIEQVWFAGVHADVGGWYHQRGLSNTAFQWMMSKAREMEMQVDERTLGRFEPDSSGPLHDSYEGFWTFRGKLRRSLPEGAKIHNSVKARLEDASTNYDPKNLPNNYQFVG